MRDDLTKSAKTKDDAAHKRIMQKLEREKTDEKKKLQTELQMLDESNADAKGKLDEEERKHDQLLFDRMTLQENFERKTAKKKEDLEVVAEQDENILQLKQKIEEEQAKDNEQSEELKKAEKLNKLEETRSRDFQQKSAALKSKLEFIMTHYEYRAQVMGIREDVLTKVIKRNEDVSLSDFS